MAAASRLVGGIPHNHPQQNGAGPSAAEIARAAPGKSGLWWQGSQYSDTHEVAFNNDVVERTKMKIKWLSDVKGISQKEALNEALTQYFEREARMLGVDV